MKTRYSSLRFRAPHDNRRAQIFTLGLAVVLLPLTAQGQDSRSRGGSYSGGGAYNGGGRSYSGGYSSGGSRSYGNGYSVTPRGNFGSSYASPQSRDYSNARTGVSTPYYAGRSQAGQGYRPYAMPLPSRNYGSSSGSRSSGSYDRFYRTSESYHYPASLGHDNLGRFNDVHGNFRYDNGGWGRDHFSLFVGFGGYFPGSRAYFPYYAAVYDPFDTFYSPYGYYYGEFPPYISSAAVIVAPPTVVYVPVPYYMGDNFHGWQNHDDVDDYYLNRQRSQSDSQYAVGEQDRIADPALASSLADIHHAWQDRDIQQLAKHVRTGSRIAVYLRGKYQYSLNASDYLDMTRDAFRATSTVRFELDPAVRKENGIYTVTGRHVYKNKQGEERTVYISYVFEKRGDQYFITQIGTAPDRVETAPDNNIDNNNKPADQPINPNN